MTPYNTLVNLAEPNTDSRYVSILVLNLDPYALLGQNPYMRIYRVTIYGSLYTGLQN